MDRKGQVRGAMACGIVFFASACGGNGSYGSLNSTIAPPPPPLTSTYTKIADMTGDRTFQSGGVQYNTTSAGISGGTKQDFGSGVTIAYTAASDSYRLTSADGASFTFTPAMAQPPSNPNTQTWVNVSGTQRDQLTLIVPSSSTGVALSYTVLGSWGRFDTTTTNGTIRLAVGGAPTQSTDMPRSGTATYNAATGGTMVSGGQAYNLQANSTMTFSANFAANTIATVLNLAGLSGTGPVTSFGAFTGNGTISSTGSGFSGTLTGTGATGLFSGGFFGPQAQEMGMAWYLNGASLSGAGMAAGIKQ